MSLLGGIVRLSEIDIDGDKDWQGKKITNLKAVVDGMVKGDIGIAPLMGVLICWRRYSEFTD
ncbi:hypothetical protein ES703_116273 [subsurface metagenome]